MLRRSDFIAATYALSFVFANFGIAIAARMPMMTTTIKSSMRVNPFLLRDIGSPAAVRDAKQLLPSCMMRTLQDPFCNCVFPVRSLYRVTFSLTQRDRIVMTDFALALLGYGEVSVMTTDMPYMPSVST